MNIIRIQCSAPKTKNPEDLQETSKKNVNTGQFSIQMGHISNKISTVTPHPPPLGGHQHYNLSSTTYDTSLKR